MFFSVIIPTYNRENEISRAITSVINQTMGDFEIIIVDDGSTDNTEAIVKSFNDDRIRFVKQKNSGATVARNTGIENSQGDVISFLDSDDEWMPTMLENQKRVYDSDTDITFVYSNVQLKYPNGTTKPFGKKLGISGNAYSQALAQGYIAPTSVLSAKRECFKRIGGFDVSLPASQDDDMCFRLAKHFKCGYIDQVLANMYIGPENRISKNRKKVAMGWWMLWNKFENDILVECGKDTLIRHYFNCANYFAQAADIEHVNSVIERVKLLGVKVSPYRLFLLNRLANSNGFMKRVYYRLLKK